VWRVYVLLILVTVISGMTPVAATLATRELPPLSLAAVRFGTAGALLALTLRALRLPWSIPRSDWFALCGLGALCVPVNQVCYMFGLRLANATHGGIAYALVPVMVFWISFGLGRASLTGRMIRATSLASLGAVMVILATEWAGGGSIRFSSQFVQGDVLLLCAAASWSLFAVASQPLVRRHGAIPTLTAVFLVGTVLHAPLVAADYFLFDLGRFSWGSVTWKGAAGFAFITLITAYLNYLLWYLVVARFDVTRSAVVTNANFLVTVAIEAVFFQLRVSWWVAVGSAVLLYGILLSVPPRGGSVAGRAVAAVPGREA
jgi:drug/metabolite transporter (DMT)-like permease